MPSPITVGVAMRRATGTARWAGGVRGSDHRGVSTSDGTRSSDPCHCEVSGELGEGSGRWRLSVTTEQSIQVMSVLKTPEHLTNLSTVRYAGFAPPDGATFNARFAGRRVRATDGSGYVDFVSSGRFSESDDDGVYEGGYTYENEGPNSGTLVFDYDDGDRCTHDLTFRTETSGETTEVCKYGGTFTYSWQTIDRP